MDQIQVFLDNLNVLNPFQSGFRMGYSTEMVPLPLVDDFQLRLDKGNFYLSFL